MRCVGCHLVHSFQVRFPHTFSHGAIGDDKILLQQTAGEIE